MKTYLQRRIIRTIQLGYYLFWGIIAPFAAFGTQSVVDDAKPSIFQHLYRESSLQIDLTYDHKLYVKNKRTENYQPATMRVRFPDGIEETWDIEIRPRGNMRRKVCDIAPIKVRFSEAQLEERGFKTRSTLKMVNLCRKGTGYEQLLLREYLAYQLYNIITPYSYRVQLARIRYVDNDGGKSISDSYAFFIEHPNDLADRTGATMLDEDVKFSPSLMNSDVSETFALFQYMIGNTDWYFFNNHNVDLLGIPGTSQIIPIPYDFDYAGIVKTPYAAPFDKLRIKDVTERYYQGGCREEAETMKTIQLFLNHKEEVMQRACEFSYFEKYSRKFVSRYLSSFFAILENPKARKREILEHCDMWPVP